MKAVVVGAGPAGSYIAYLLAKQGHNVTLLEDHPQVGIPVQCTGIVTPAIEELVKLPQSVIKAHLARARIFAPDNTYVEIKMKPNIILCRASFDQFLAQKAQDAGAELLLSHRFISHNEKTIHVKDIAKNELKQYTPEIVIGADGPSSHVAKSYGFYGKRSFFLGAQATVKMTDAESIDFYPTPEGIFWSVPEGNNLYRVGVGVYHNASYILQNFLHTRCPNKPILEYQGGLIPVYDPTLPIEQDNVYLIGDAATQVKATTAGGIIQSLTAAKCLAQSIETGESYTTLTKKALGRELWLHLKIREIMDRFSPEDYNKLIAYTNTPKIKEILGTHNRDNLFSFFFKMLLYEPRYIAFARNFFSKPAVTPLT